MKCDVHILTSPKWSTPKYETECFNSIAHEPVHVHVLDAIDGKIGQARAQGFSLGTAPYVSFMDSDDLIVPGTYQQCIDYLDGNSDVDIVFTLEDHIDARGRPIISHQMSKGKITNIMRRFVPVGLRALKLVHQIVVTRRESMEPYLEFLEGWDNMPEKALWAQQMLDRRHFALLPIVGHKWRQHSRQQAHRGITSEIKERYKSLLNEVEKAFPG